MESRKKFRDLSIRDMLKITRTLNENDELGVDKKTVYDQNAEEEKFLNYFSDLMVNVKFIDIEIHDELVYWGGTIDGVIQFVFKVTPDDSTSGVEFNYLEDFSPDNPENQVVIDRVTSYFEVFYKYWTENMIQK